MTALLITSFETGSGKTMLCAGLGRYLADSGKKAGYLRLAAASNGDASFMKGLLGMDEPLDKIGLKDLASLKEAYREVTTGKDITFIEIPGKDAVAAAEAVNAGIVAVERDTRKLSEYKSFGKRLLGMIINKVPVSQLNRAREQLTKPGEVGIRVLGILPEDRTLLAPSVGELAGSLQGRVLDGETQLSELVESVMLGAMYVDSGLEYFGRKSNKAVVLRSERPDMQLAALETSTRCLVLTGDRPPANIVLLRAREKKVPIILTGGDVAAAVAVIEKALSESRFSQIKKLPRLMEIMKRDFDFVALSRELGLVGK